MGTKIWKWASIFALAMVLAVGCGDDSSSDDDPMGDGDGDSGDGDGDSGDGDGDSGDGDGDGDADAGTGDGPEEDPNCPHYIGTVMNMDIDLPGCCADIGQCGVISSISNTCITESRFIAELEPGDPCGGSLDAGM